MKSQDEPQCLFTGKFRVASLYLNVLGQGWTLSKEYDEDSFKWDFYGIRMLKFDSGKVAFEGKLKEEFAASPKEITEFAYYPDDRQLYIDRSDYAPDGFCNICINYRYRVERVSETEFWLYDLEDVDKEPEDYRYRIKIRKA